MTLCSLVVSTDISQACTVPIIRVLLYHCQNSVYIFCFPIQAKHVTHCYFPRPEVTKFVICLIYPPLNTRFSFFHLLSVHCGYLLWGHWALYSYAATVACWYLLPTMTVTLSQQRYGTVTDCCFYSLMSLSSLRNSLLLHSQRVRYWYHMSSISFKQ
jgi:hypothetical protein